MSSALSASAEASDQNTWVRTLSAEDLLAALPPPYDLIKLDVEGAEYDFLEGYGAVLAQTRFLLLEWHAAPGDARGPERLRALAGIHRFKELPIRMGADPHRGTPQVQTGLMLLRRGDAK